MRVQDGSVLLWQPIIEKLSCSYGGRGNFSDENFFFIAIDIQNLE